jgi:hypothetical protein
LVIGQDPGQHENILRRILVGEAGRRVQGLLTKVGITKSYVLINALLYSVYGSRGGKYVDDPGVASYRNLWIDRIVGPGKVEAIVAFGGFAHKAADVWKQTPTGAASSIPVVKLKHPTYPESSGETAEDEKTKTAEMLAEWNDGLTGLFSAVQHRDVPTAALTPYGTAFKDSDKVDIPSADLPAGIPAWMYDDDGWAQRGFPSSLPTPDTDAEKRLLKRSIIVVRTPKGVIP